MVDIRHIPLKIFLGVMVLAAGCAMNPFQSQTPARVEEPARPAEPRAQSETHIEHPPAPVTAPTPLPAPPPYTDDTLELPAENQEMAKSGPAVVALLDDADRNTAAGKRERAIASLERALRIEPKNPLPWHKLSRLRLEEKNWKQALALAKKSNVLAAGNKVLQAENWKIIAHASAALGDASGAAKAREMVRQLEKKH